MKYVFTYILYKVNYLHIASQVRKRQIAEKSQIAEKEEEEAHLKKKSAGLGSISRHLQLQASETNVQLAQEGKI